MAGIQANGIGSGLDINSLVSQLVTAEATPLQQRITRHEVAVTTKVSALATLKGALAAFKSALEPLKSVDAFQSRKATSADNKIFTVTADTDAVAGHYNVEVVQLAKAHQLASQPFLGGSTATVGYGSLAISVGDKTFNVDIKQDAATLDDIRNAINAASDNTGVQATLLNTADGSRLILTANATGESSVIKVVASGGDGNLNKLNYDPLSPPVPPAPGLTELEPAQNAKIRVATFDIESDTNVFENAIDGVTITAVAESEGEEVGLDVAFDKGTVQTRIQKFVTEYNSMQAVLAKLGSYDAETKTGGPLLGDSLLRAIETETRRALSNPVSGTSSTYTTLASLGITTNATGALSLDPAKLTKALDADPEGVAELFGGENGVAARLFSQLDSRLATAGDIETRNTSLKKELKGIDSDKEALNLRMAQVETRLRKQFTALDSLLSQMQSTSSYLTQQLANIPKIGS
ncbi:MAG TPA: flagellar filament capping protein FliD [Steroidobacteraceae bacterium]|nr:flagellar filament capping protein FliD [Steroidobacteraceae bacterium]